MWCACHSAVFLVTVECCVTHKNDWRVRVMPFSGTYFIPSRHFRIIIFLAFVNTNNMSYRHDPEHVCFLSANAHYLL